MQALFSRYVIDNWLYRLFFLWCNIRNQFFHTYNSIPEIFWSSFFGIIFVTAVCEIIKIHLSFYNSILMSFIPWILNPIFTLQHSASWHITVFGTYFSRITDIKCVSRTQLYLYPPKYFEMYDMVCKNCFFFSRK